MGTNMSLCSSLICIHPVSGCIGLGLLKVIQGQRSVYQLKAHVWFLIQPPLSLTSYHFRDV